MAVSFQTIPATKQSSMTTSWDLLTPSKGEEDSSEEFDLLPPSETPIENLPGFHRLTGYVFLGQGFIDQGSTAQIYKVLDQCTNKVCAAKVFKVGKRAIQEVNILETLKKKYHALQYHTHGYINPCNAFPAIITDLIPCKDLFSYRGNLSFEQILTILRQSLELLEQMHQNAIAHGDLKPENMLFNLKTNHLTIIDMDLSENYNKEPKKDDGFGTLEYIAPELLLGCGQYDTSIDIWSLACTLFDLFTGKRLFKPSSNKPDEYILHLIIAEMGIPPKKFLKTLKKTKFFFKTDINNNYIFKYDLPKISKSWKERMRNAGIKRQYSSVQVEALIGLMDKMLRYNHRITARNALNYSLFKKDRRFKIIIKGLSHPASYEFQLVSKIYKRIKKHLTIDLCLSSTTLKCLHVPARDAYILRIKYKPTGTFLLKKLVKIPSDSRIVIKENWVKYKKIKIIKSKIYRT